MKVKRVTKVMAAALAAVMMVGVAKVPVKAYYSSDTRTQKFATNIEGCARNYISDNQQTASLDTWIQGSSATVALSDMKLQEYHPTTGHRYTRTHTQTQGPTGVNVTFTASSGYSITGLTAKHSISSYNWVKVTETGTIY